MAEYARMLDKRKKPTEDAINKVLGLESAARLQALELFLQDHYLLARELRFPFGDNYGWGYKFTHGRKHLCYVFFEEGAFTVTLQIDDNAVDAVEKALPSMLPQTGEIWAGRRHSGEKGGWIHYRVLSDDVLPDIEQLITLGVKPDKA